VKLFGDKRIPIQKLSWNTSSRIGSLDNYDHIPGGGDKPIPNYPVKMNGKSKIGSLDNFEHVPGGGHVVLPKKSVKWKSGSKIGSLEKIHHIPGGGDKPILNQKLRWQARSKIGSLDNAHHQPGGGFILIPQRRVIWKARAKIDSLKGEELRAQILADAEQASESEPPVIEMRPKAPSNETSGLSGITGKPLKRSRPKKSKQLQNGFSSEDSSNENSAPEEKSSRVPLPKHSSQVPKLPKILNATNDRDLLVKYHKDAYYRNEAARKQKANAAAASATVTAAPEAKPVHRYKKRVQKTYDSGAGHGVILTFEKSRTFDHAKKAPLQTAKVN
jgi:hypothetical protein